MVADLRGGSTPPERIHGCLLGGALGDALGGTIEFQTLAQIRRQYGPDGIQDFSHFRVGQITDDTQMTLFTAEGLIRAMNRYKGKGTCSVESVVHHAYQRWLYTQGEIPESPIWGSSAPDGWLVGIKGLRARRAPGNTCLGALRSGIRGTIESPINNSKGCGGVMRVAPVGLSGVTDVFRTGCELAAITHGHPSGYLAAGFFSQIICDLFNGGDLSNAIAHALTLLKKWRGHEECTAAVERAVCLAETQNPSPEKVESLAAGWVAEEALAISLYCALVADDFVSGVRLAVNHSGDSDSTGAITGNILGTMMGRRAIPEDWLAKLELREETERVAEDMVAHFVRGGRGLDEEKEWCKYPGW